MEILNCDKTKRSCIFTPFITFLRVPVSQMSLFFRNPMGRTGLKGRGALWRWGPNHEILAVCTRWRRTPSSDGQPSGDLYVEGKRVLEFIAIRKVEGTDDTCFGLPGVIELNCLFLLLKKIMK